MRVTAKIRILNYVRIRGWVSGSELEDQAHEWFTKPSVVTRRARELVNDGYLERRIGERRTVEYRIASKEAEPTYSDHKAISWLHES